MPDGDPPTYPVSGDPFSPKKPKDHGPAHQRWGRKTFTRDNVPDDRVRMALVTLQDFTNKVREVEEAEQMPPDELARRAGISVKNMQAVLRGDHPPTWETMCALLAVLDMAVAIDPKLDHRPTIEAEPGRPENWLPGTRRPRKARGGS